MEMEHFIVYRYKHVSSHKNSDIHVAYEINKHIDV